MFIDCFIRPGEDGYIAPGPDETQPGCWATPGNSPMPICTREDGHEGDHAAHNLDNTMLAYWPNTTRDGAAS